MTRILIIGARDYTAHDIILRELKKYPRTSTVVHGAAPGADSIADRVAKALGMGVEPHPALWDKYGTQAVPIRNQEMVDAGADVCLAFPGPNSSGTWDCVRRARAAGITVHVIRRQP